MAKAGIIEIDLTANTARFQSDMKKATSALNSNVAQMRRSTSSLEKGFKSLAGGVKGLAAAFVATKLMEYGTQVLRVADEYNALQARIKNATKATGDYAAVSRELANSAKNTGAELENNVALFQRLSMGAKDLGKSNADVLKLTETVNQLGVISGASGEAMKAGTLQFSQAMSGAVFRAEEFNSLVENMPAVVDRLAKGMNITKGELRQLVLDGKLLSSEVFDVLLSQSEEIKKEFNEMPLTMERGFNKLKISLAESIGRIDQATGATQVLAKSFSDLADWIDKNQEAIVNLTGFIFKFGETAVQMGSMVISAIGTATNAVATGILNIVAIQMQAIENMVNTTGKRINELISLVNNIPGVNIGKVGQFRLPGHNAVDNLAALSWRDTKMFGSSFVNTGRDILSGKSAFGGYKGSGVGSVSNIGGMNRSGGGAGGKDKKGKKGSHAKSEAEKEMDRLKQEAQSLSQAMRTIWEVEAAEIAKANKLFKLKLIDMQTYNRALDEAKTKSKDAFKIEGLEEAMKAFMEPHKKFVDDFNTGLGEALNDTAFQEGLAIREQLLTNTQKLSLEQAKLNDYVERGMVTQIEADAYMKQYAESLNNTTNNAQQYVQAIGNVISQFGDQFFDTVVSGFKGAEVSMRDFVSSALVDLSKLIFKLTVTLPLINAINKAFGGTGNTNAQQGGGGVNLFGSLFKSGAKLLGFADGGNPPVGVPSMVGERGPELFVPKTAGTIIPNHQLGGGGGQPIYVTIKNNYALGVQSTVRAEMEAQRPRMMRDAVKAMETAIGRGGKTAQSVGRRS